MAIKIPSRGEAPDGRSLFQNRDTYSSPASGCRLGVLFK